MKKVIEEEETMWDTHGKLVFEDAPAILAAVEVNMKNEPQAPLVAQTALKWVEFLLVGLLLLCSPPSSLSRSLFPFPTDFYWDTISHNCAICNLAR